MLVQAKAKRKEIAARLGRPTLECNQYEDVRTAANAVPRSGCHAKSAPLRRARRRRSSPERGGPLCPLQIIAMDVVNPDHIKVTFDSIGGLDDIKSALHELVILPLVRPELFTKGKLLKPVKVRRRASMPLRLNPRPQDSDELDGSLSSAL